MNLQDGRAKLGYAAQKLRLRWDEANRHWNDAVSRDFERDHLVPLEPQIAATLQAIDRLADVISRAERECQ